MNIEWRRRPLFFAALVFSACVFIGESLPFRSSENILPQNIFLGGSVVSEVETRTLKFGTPQAVFILSTEKIWKDAGDGGRKHAGRVRVSWTDAPPDLRYGDRLVLQGEESNFDPRRNPGGFDSSAYWRWQKVQASFQSNKNSRYKILARDKGNPLKAAAIAVKQNLSHRLDGDFGARDAAFLKALFLGQRSDLDQDFKDLFLKTGTMHILSSAVLISGLSQPSSGFF